MASGRSKENNIKVPSDEPTVHILVVSDDEWSEAMANSQESITPDEPMVQVRASSIYLMINLKETETRKEWSCSTRWTDKEQRFIRRSLSSRQVAAGSDFLSTRWTDGACIDSFDDLEKPNSNVLAVKSSASDELIMRQLKLPRLLLPGRACSYRQEDLYKGCICKI
jgi:hypothetical protein